MMKSTIPNGKWLEPEAALSLIRQSIPGYSRLAMAGTFVIGLATHMFFLVNKLPNGDDLSELYHYNSMITSGRWLDVLSKGLTSYYSIPWATGLVCLALLAVSCALICSLLGLRRKSTVLAAAAILTAFPTMASYFSYMYYMDLYMLTLLFNVWAVWLAKRKAWELLPGAALIAMGLGNYQAYLGVTAVLCLLVLARECLEESRTPKQILYLAARFLAMGAAGLALYFLILRGALYIFSAGLSDYQGIAGMGEAGMDAAALLSYIRASYTDFFGFFYRDRFFTSPPAVKCLYSLLLLLSLAWLGVAVLQKSGWQPQAAAGKREPRTDRPSGAVKLILLALWLGLLPVAYNLIYIMAPGAFLHSLMLPQYALFWLMPLMLFELAYPEKAGGAGRKTTAFQGVSHWLLLGAVAGLFYFFFLTVNISYLHLHLKYEITYATELRILDRIEAIPDYNLDTPVCVVGAFPSENMSLYPYHTQDLVKGLVGINGNLVHHYYNYNGFYKNYLGRQLNLLREDDPRKLDIQAWPAVARMPIWPKEGSVNMIEGVVIVKINDPPSW
ncbi:MAG: glucosyltransferase domain-containing protein [Clostridiales bacterium]|nr:glucosyltransferase domain-containing protein [Clostridiales bacterium]